MSSIWLSCTSRRLGAWQDCPLLENPRWMLKRAAFSRSPSVSTMFADLPPSSRHTRLTVLAAASPTRTPASVEPVKETKSTSGWLDMASPTTLPRPMIRLKTPAGVPASSMISARATPEAGEASEGLRTIVHPAAMP